MNIEILTDINASYAIKYDSKDHDYIIKSNTRTGYEYREKTIVDALDSVKELILIDINIEKFSHE